MWEQQYLSASQHRAVWLCVCSIFLVYGCSVVTATDRVKLCLWWYLSSLVSDFYLSCCLQWISKCKQQFTFLYPSFIPYTSTWLLSGIEEEVFKKYSKFPINLFVSLSFDGRLAVSQELTQLWEGGATVVMQLLRGGRENGNVSLSNLPLVYGFRYV